MLYDKGVDVDVLVIVDVVGINMLGCLYLQDVDEARARIVLVVDDSGDVVHLVVDRANAPPLATDRATDHMATDV